MQTRMEMVTGTTTITIKVTGMEIMQIRMEMVIGMGTEEAEVDTWDKIMEDDGIIIKAEVAILVTSTMAIVVALTIIMLVFLVVFLDLEEEMAEDLSSVKFALSTIILQLSVGIGSTRTLFQTSQ